MLSDISSGYIDSSYAAGYREALINRYCVRHPVSRIEHNTRRSTAGVQGKHCLYRCVQRWNVEGLKENLSGRIAVASGVQRWFRKQDWVLRAVSQWFCPVPHIESCHTSSLRVLSPSP